MLAWLPCLGSVGRTFGMQSLFPAQRDLSSLGTLPQSVAFQSLPCSALGRAEGGRVSRSLAALVSH